MKIKKSVHMKVVVLRLSGALMGPPDTEEFLRMVSDLLNEGFRRMVLDMAHTRWINSQGIGALVRAYKLITEKDGHLILASLSEKVRSVMTISQLARIFEVRDSVNVSVAELNGVRQE